LDPDESEDPTIKTGAMSLPKVTSQHHNDFKASAGAAAPRSWVVPTVVRLEAGAAEVGPNPVRPENLADGS
jgi:hypothetical protein